MGFDPLSHYGPQQRAKAAIPVLYSEKEISVYTLVMQQVRVASGVTSHQVMSIV